MGKLYKKNRNQKSSNPLRNIAMQRERDRIATSDMSTTPKRDWAYGIVLSCNEGNNKRKFKDDSYRTGDQYKWLRDAVIPKLIDSNDNVELTSDGDFYRVYVRYPDLDKHLSSPLLNNASYGQSIYWRRVVLHKKAYVPAKSFLGVFKTPPSHGSVYKFKFTKGGEQENETSSGIAIQLVSEFSEKWYNWNKVPTEILDASKSNDNTPIKPTHRQKPIPDDKPKTDRFYGKKPRCVDGKIMYDTPLDSDSKIDEAIHNERMALLDKQTTLPDPDDFDNDPVWNWFPYDEYVNEIMDLESGGGKNVINSVGMVGKYQFSPGTLVTLDLMPGLDKSDYDDIVKKAKRKYPNNRGPGESNYEAYYSYISDQTWLAADWSDSGAHPDTETTYGALFAADMKRIADDYSLSETEKIAAYRKQWMTGYSKGGTGQNLAMARLVGQNLWNASQHKGADLSNPADVAGRAAYSHLLGAGAARNWASDGIDKADGNRTPGSYYYAEVSYAIMSEECK